MIRRAGSHVVALSRSIALIIALFVGLPWALVAASRARFGGAAPLQGVPAPGDWQADRIKRALIDRLTEDTIADIVIRLSLIVAWCALVVLAVTIVTEILHMARHDGLSVPDIRGLGMSQSLARVIATGLLVIVPMIATPSRAGARDGVTQLLPTQRVAASLVSQNDRPVAAPGSVRVASAPSNVPHRTDDVSGVDHLESDESGRYVVRSGDSVYGIAGRLAGPDPGAIADFAERLLELNLGTQMPDGRHFTNAAFIDIGWVLQLPPLAADDVEPSLPKTSHVVEPGESLWSVADTELGDPARWPEIYDVNHGRSFDDGREFVDPDLIQPGWELDLPGVDGGDSDTTVAAEPAPPDNVWESTAPDVHVRPATDAADRLPPEVPSEAMIDVRPDRRADVTPASSSVSVPSQSAPVDLERAVAEPDVGEVDRQPSDGPELLTFTNAAMLSAGVMTLLAVRRRNQLRRARPRTRLPAPAPGPALTERKLRAIDPGDRLGRLDMAIRSVAGVLVEQGARVLAALVTADGDLELRLSGAATLPAPWFGGTDSWHLATSTPIELLVEDAYPAGSPCPAMIQLGRDPDGCDVYVDLEACEAIEIDGPADRADAIVAAAAATLAGSVLAEVTTLIGLGVPDEAFLGHRLHMPVLDGPGAFDAAREAIGSTASAAISTFELRSRAVAGETWEPAVVLAGSSAGTLTPPAVRTGIAVLSASPIHGPSCRLAPDGDAWQLEPIGLRLVPIGLGSADVAALADLLEIRAPVPEPVDVIEIVSDDTIVECDPNEPGDTDHRAAGRGMDDVGEPGSADDPSGEVGGVGDDIGRHGQSGNTDAPVVSESFDGDEATDAGVERAPEWRLMVRVLGPVEVVSADGETVTFERSKARELIAWLATHRTNSTRSAARTALWELDVRDATFANVVSEARRSLARLVEPPVGDEWVGRTMTESLPLHELVRTDADLVDHALAVARLQPPAQAIATLSPVVELISGLPFEGTSYLWPDPEGITSNLVLLATSAAAELAAHCLSVGDISGVFRSTGRGLRVLPGHEELIGLRMKAHARAGDHAGVRQEWESYERVINADPWSDGEPSPKLVELRRDLLNPSR